MITSKKCSNCHKTKKISNFYVHRDFREGSGYDNWCRECAKKESKDINSLINYCKENNRKFQEELFNSVEISMKEKYKDDVDFNSLSEEKRESFLFEKILNQYFSRQSSTQWYSYVKNEDSPVKVKEENIEDDEIEVVRKGKERKVYSQDWQGTYTQSQIDWLDAYFKDTCNDFTVVTRNHFDYVRKIAKASLAMDEAFNDMMNKVSGADKQYKEAKAVFDTLSQSAKLSEKTRNANDVAGFGSLSEITLRLEQTGFLQKKITFEKDHIDKINDDLRWVLSSVGGDL
jgi:hypothetical protein